MGNQRPCERCGVTLTSEYENDNYHPMCVEIQMAYGIIAWLCFDCRKAWHRTMKNEMMSKQYSEASLRFEFWKATVSATGNGSPEEGLELWRHLDALEIKLNNFANEWLISDPDRDSPNRNHSFADDDS